MSNGRIEGADTPEERLAAIAVTVFLRISSRGRAFGPDYADFRDEFRQAFRHQLQREQIKVRMEELEQAPCAAEYKTRRKAQLMREYAKIPVP